MKLSPQLSEQLADLFCLCANAYLPGTELTPQDCYHRAIALIETAPLTADALPTVPEKKPVVLYPPCPLPEVERA